MKRPCDWLLHFVLYPLIFRICPVPEPAIIRENVRGKQRVARIPELFRENKYNMTCRDEYGLHREIKYCYRPESPEYLNNSCLPPLQAIAPMINCKTSICGPAHKKIPECSSFSAFRDE